MHTKTFKFDIEVIADTILKEVEDLIIEKSNIIVNDFEALHDSFGKVKKLKSDLGLMTADIVFIWKNKGWDEKFNKTSYKKEIAEIHNRLNIKFSESKKIPMFFRGGEKSIPSFHFPAALNVWFLTDMQFTKSKIKPIVVVNFGASSLHSYLVGKFSTQEDSKILDYMKYYFVEVNDFFDFDKHVENVWEDESAKKEKQAIDSQKYLEM